MKNLLLILIVILCGLNGYCSVIQDQIQKAYSKRIKFYPLYYNTLQLTPEQISEFEYIIEKYNKDYKDNLNNSKYLKTLSKQEEKELKKILDKRQKTQFKILKHLEKQDIRRSLQEKNYYRYNPRMSTFGNLEKK